MKRAGLVFSLVAVLGLSGCGYFDSYFTVDKLNKAQPTGSLFNQELAAQYKTRANTSMDRYNYTEASRVAQKGLVAADGADVEPYTLDGWQLPQDKMDELQQARQRLVNALAAKDSAPREAAAAQAKFDCWVEDSEKTWNPEQLKTCRAEFMDALTTLESAAGIPQISKGDGLENDQTFTGSPLDKASYYVFFNVAQNKLSADAKQSIATFAADIMSRDVKTIQVIGYTDATGKPKTNLKISKQRAAIVAKELQKNGIPASIIKTDGRGASNPLVPTAKGKSEPSNRRVEIIID